MTAMGQSSLSIGFIWPQKPCETCISVQDVFTCDRCEESGRLAAWRKEIKRIRSMRHQADIQRMEEARKNADD